MEDHGKSKKVELNIIIIISCEVFSVTEQRKEFDNKFYLHKDSLSLQVKASGSEVDDLIDKMNDLKDNKETEACILNCIQASGSSSAAELQGASTECMKQCIPADVFCGGACIMSHNESGDAKNEEEVEEVCTTDESHPCYKCIEKCANGAGAVAATSFAIFFSLAVASFMM